MFKKFTRGKNGKLYNGKGTLGGLAPSPPEVPTKATLPLLPVKPSLSEDIRRQQGRGVSLHKAVQSLSDEIEGSAQEIWENIGQASASWQRDYNVEEIYRDGANRLLSYELSDSSFRLSRGRAHLKAAIQSCYYISDVTGRSPKEVWEDMEKIAYN
jgi:hypothetical protein